VIYSDNDPIAVTFGQEILGDTPNVRYVYCDVAEPHALLDSPVVTRLLGDDRRVGIGFVGVFLYVPDEPLARFFTTLYKWVDRGSYIAVSSAGREVTEMEGMEDMFSKLRTRLYGRSAQETLDLIGPWQLMEPGLTSGVYWGLPEDAPEINETIREHGYTFVAHK
jgi:O-methyltransferase involved in polyketide biosynthesis